MWALGRLHIDAVLARFFRIGMHPNQENKPEDDNGQKLCAQFFLSPGGFWLRSAIPRVQESRNMAVVGTILIWALGRLHIDAVLAWHLRIWMHNNENKRNHKKNHKGNKKRNKTMDNNNNSNNSDIKTKNEKRRKLCAQFCPSPGCCLFCCCSVLLPCGSQPCDTTMHKQRAGGIREAFTIMSFDKKRIRKPSKNDGAGSASEQSKNL